MGIRTACRQIAACSSLRSLLVVPFIILAAACSENATEPAATDLDVSPSSSLADAQISGIAGPISSKLAAGKCLDQKASGDGSQAVISSCDGSKEQTFTWRSNGSIVNGAGACLAAEGTGYAARVLVKGCDGSEKQRWSATKAGEIRGIGGKCVGVAWNRPTDGTKLVMWTCNGTPSQQWSASGSTSVSEASVGSISNLSVASGKSYKIVANGARAGATLYVDRGYTLRSPVPSSIEGATLIQTSNDDKYAKLGSSSFLSFDVDGSVVVYVAHDDQIKVPSWLSSNFKDSGADLISSDNNGKRFSLFKRSYSKGRVTLGSNADANDMGSMYVVLVVGGSASGPVTTPPDSEPDNSDAPPSSSDGPHSGLFVSPSGSGSASGSESSPMSLSAALSGGNGRIQPGDTVWIKGGTYSGDFNVSLSGSSSAPIIFRQYPGERATINGTLDPSGRYLWFWGLEVANKNSGDQATGGVSSTCTGCRFINMVIHDHSSNGLGMWATGSDQEAYGNIIYNNGFYGLSSDHAAHGIYAQNTSGTQKIIDNILFDQFGFGVHVYGEGTGLNNYTITGNTAVNNGIGEQTGMSGGMDYQVGGMTQLRNLVFTNNHSYRSPGNRGNTARVGYEWGPTNSGGVITDNYFVGEFLTPNWGSVTMSANTALDGSMPSQTKVIVQPNKYEAGRANVIVYNWGRQGAVSVDLSKVLRSGDSYEVRNALNFYASPVASGTYSGGSVSLPITSASPAPTISSRGKPVSTSTEFNAYVIVRK